MLFGFYCPFFVLAVLKRSKQGWGIRSRLIALGMTNRHYLVTDVFSEFDERVVKSWWWAGVHFAQ